MGRRRSPSTPDAAPDEQGREPPVGPSPKEGETHRLDAVNEMPAAPQDSGQALHAAAKAAVWM